MKKIEPYRLARIFAISLPIFAVLFLLGSGLLLVLPRVDLDGLLFNLGPREQQNLIPAYGAITALVSLVGMIVTMAGTTTTILIGWRSERRQSEEFKLKIKQLEFQLEEAKEKRQRESLVNIPTNSKVSKDKSRSRRR
jgi:hypothetical protein